jgi:pimeloyl-ACP methyl ester carboxylesterase
MNGGNSMVNLADDVAVTKSAIDSLNSKVVLVGHSYGGELASGL